MDVNKWWAGGAKKIKNRDAQKKKKTPAPADAAPVQAPVPAVPESIEGNDLPLDMSTFSQLFIEILLVAKLVNNLDFLHTAIILLKPLLLLKDEYLNEDNKRELEGHEKDTNNNRRKFTSTEYEIIRNEE